MCRCKPYKTTPVQVDIPFNAAVRLQAAWRGHQVRKRCCLIKLQAGQLGQRRHGFRWQAMERSERLHLLLQQLSSDSALCRSKIAKTRSQLGGRLGMS